MPTRRNRNRKRKTRRGGNWWNYGPSAEEFADEIIANLLNDKYLFTDKINNMSSYNLQKVIDKLEEKSNFVDENTRKSIDARIRQLNYKIADLKRSVPSIHNMV
jgi:hypothetical protein